jgi:hypothetical protein
MGFSNFGGQRNKRRKYNPNADAAFDATGDLLPAGSGSNNTPLGARANTNKDEIPLDNEPDESGDKDDDPGPQYIDTSRPAAPIPGTTPGEDDIQAKIDDILGTTSNPTDSLPFVQSLPLHHHPSQHSPSGHRGRGGGQSSRGGGHHHGGHGSWWVDYYDPTANMNPWEKLEKDRDMEPADSWLSWETSKAKWEEVKTQVGKVNAT